MDFFGNPILLGGIALALVALGVGLWLTMGRGPRRRRFYRRAQRLLREGKWHEALAAVRDLQALAPLPPAWEGRARNAEGECHRAGGEAALAGKSYEKALEQFRNAARLLNLGEAPFRNRIVDAMLDEIRGLFAADAGSVHPLIGRLLLIHSPCPEASFWQGMAHIREGRTDLAAQSLRTAHEGTGKAFIDPPFYLGVLQLRNGQPQEALRYLAEANRIDSSCAFVTWQLGLAIVAAGGDAGLAVRALQRALAPKGLALWVRTPEKAWTEGLPGAPKSFVVRLAARHRYVCPLLGTDIAAMVRQGFLALGQAQYRLGNLAEAAAIYQNLLQESAPSLPLLRGLGLTLAKLERFDEAFKHLKTAHDMEDPKTALTAGYLALCGACAKPNRPEDKANNVNWAVRLLGRYHLDKDADWAAIHRRVFAEARSQNVPLPVEDLVRCCDVLAAVEATDADSAAAYDHLAGVSLAAVKPNHTWLYARAAQQHNFQGRADLDLLTTAFRTGPAMRDYFAQHQWDLEELEALYLVRWAGRHPGTFPEVFGTDYPPYGEKRLLARSQQQEAAGQPEAALATVAALLKLAPRSARAHDRLACLHYRKGDVDEAVRLLGNWEALHPADPWPLLRRAVLEQNRGNGAARSSAIDKALSFTRGPFRAEVAFLGARLALTEPVLARSASEGSPNPAPVFRYLEECLNEQPTHPGALALLAALRWQAGERSAVAALSPRMHPAHSRAAGFHYLAAVCHLAAGEWGQVIESAQRVDEGPLAVEGQYLLAVAHARQKNRPAAIAALEKVAQTPQTPSGDQARGLLGRLHFHDGKYHEATEWWKALDANKRAAWNLDETLRGAVFLAGLQAHHLGKYEQAAEKYREAGKLGWRDRRLGPLLQLALFKAGQQLLYRADAERGETPATVLDHYPRAAALLSQAIQVGRKDPAAGYLLALACKRQNKIADARSALRKLLNGDANLYLQMGLLSLREKQPAQAEPEFGRAWELDPNNFAVGANLLLTRLSLGQTEWAAALAPQVTALSKRSEDRQLFRHLQALLWCVQSGRGKGDDAGETLTRMNEDDEQRLIQLVRSLGNLDTACLLFRILSASRPASALTREAHFEAVLLKGKKLLDRCEWNTAERLLTTLARERDVALPTQAALLNLLGCCSCLSQDFEEGLRYFAAAARVMPNDAGIHQNLALVHEWRRDLGQAEPHWSRYFDLLERRLNGSHRSDRISQLLYLGLHRLAGCYTDKEKWPQAITHVERIQRMRPDDVETLERLFTLYGQARRRDDAQRVLRQLRHLRPGDAQFELFELDLIELREIDDLDRWIGEIGRIVQRHPGEAKVEERGITMVANAIPLLTRICDQLTDQVNKVIRQVRDLQNYQINWQAVHEVMRDLKREFQQLRKTIGKFLAVVTHADQRRVLRDLAAHVDRKIEFCREWQGN